MGFYLLMKPSDATGLSFTLTILIGVWVARCGVRVSGCVLRGTGYLLLVTRYLLLVGLWMRGAGQAKKMGR